MCVLVLTSGKGGLVNLHPVRACLRTGVHARG